MTKTKENLETTEKTEPNGSIEPEQQARVCAGETFILYFTSGSLVAQKRITQESR